MGHFIDALTWSLCAPMDVHELDTEVDPELDELVARRATPREILQSAVDRGFITLAADGMRRVLDGTSVIAFARSRRGVGNFDTGL